MVENAAECRSDIIGNSVKWKTEYWIGNEVRSKTKKFFNGKPPLRIKRLAPLFISIKYSLSVTKIK